MERNSANEHSQEDGKLSVTHPSTEALENEQPILPHTKSSTIQAVEEVVKGVKDVVTEAVAWVEEKAVKLTEKQEDGTGPYGSPGTCAPSDLDVIATGVLPAMPPQAPQGRTNDARQEHIR